MIKKLLLATALTSLMACNAALTTFMVDKDKAFVQSLLDNPSDLNNFLSDTTIKSWESRHGTQIEYHSADGQTWLVYPGNRRSVRGAWKVRSSNGNAQICYQYGPNSYNAVTKQAGGKWECSPAIIKLLSDEVVDGDVLRLRGRGAYPQPLPARVNLSISEVKQSVGLGPLRSKNKVAWEYTR